jgi:hypothetical protein
MRHSAWLIVLALLLAFAASAAAENVDWKEFMEKPGQRYTQTTPEPVKAKPAAQREVRVAKAPAVAPKKATTKARGVVKTRK